MNQNYNLIILKFMSCSVIRMAIISFDTISFALQDSITTDCNRNPANRSHE